MNELMTHKKCVRLGLGKRLYTIKLIPFSPLERVDKWYLRVMTGGQAEGFPLGVATMAWRVGKVVGA